MALWSSDSPEISAVDIYLQDDGRLVLKHEDGFGDLTSTYVFTNSSPWVTVQINFAHGDPGGGAKNTLYINGTHDSSSTWLDFNHTWNGRTIFGPGHVGGGSAGTVPFHGRLRAIQTTPPRLNVNFTTYVERFENSLNGSSIEQFSATCVSLADCPAIIANGKFGPCERHR
jgi:hypothetical protein